MSNHTDWHGVGQAGHSAKCCHALSSRLIGRVSLLMSQMFVSEKLSGSVLSGSLSTNIRDWNASLKRDESTKKNIYNLLTLLCHTQWLLSSTDSVGRLLPSHIA